MQNTSQSYSFYGSNNHIKAPCSWHVKYMIYIQTHSSVTKLQATPKPFLLLRNNQFPEQLGFWLRPLYFSFLSYLPNEQPSPSREAFAMPGMKTHTALPQTKLRKRNLTISLPNTRHSAMSVNKWGSVDSGLSSPLHFSLTVSKESLCLTWTFWTPEIEHPSSSIRMILFEEILLLGG